jgi:hypothetical protein
LHPGPLPLTKHDRFTMNLDDSQKRTVATWLDQGLKLSEIQTRIAAELGLKLTYMEMRMLVDDLRLTPKDQEPPVPPHKPTAPTAPAAPPDGPAPLTPGAGPGRVSLSVDQVTRPGCLASGQVTFSDGQKGAWYVDHMRRLGLAPIQEGYRPSPEDVEEFQLALESRRARLGL